MAGRELVQTLDYILHRCDERDIEAVAAAVARRRREIAMFGATADPRRLAGELTSRLGVEGGIESLKHSVRDYAARIIRQQAPELPDAQIEALVRSGETAAEHSLPKDLLASMIDQFVSFSLGRMAEEEDRALRREMGPWPDRYWKNFPQVVRLLISDFLKDRMDEAEFNVRIALALQTPGFPG
uniref:Uncharacterized protein n=1 Tax=uncultured bacterium contig00013 TaxID=1181504 RepID=A0A806KMN7_9BACT|nr:hypothetical protein [uncultured bacterium contig00013]